MVVSGASARKAAAMFNIGNIIGIAVPVPLGLLWLGISMVVYAMNRHHPNPRVGHYTQQAAYRFYGITGFFVAAGAFIPRGDWQLYALAWAGAAAILVPWSLIDLARIRRETWEDVTIDEEQPS